MANPKGLITFLIGLRRIGKTTLMRIFISELQDEIKPKHILYAPLGHPAFIGHSITDIIETFRVINKIRYETKIYLFFDEI